MTGRHIFIPLEIGNENYYASCNILNDDSLLYVYLLHPDRGSFLFTLLFDENVMQYKPRYIVPGLDKRTLELINEKIHNDELLVPDVYENNYRYLETGEKYGYIVINRMFVRDNSFIKPSGKFHVLYEGWDSFSEYEWAPENGLVSLKGEMPALGISKTIHESIESMNAG